jgi:hypothetical protein
MEEELPKFRSDRVQFFGPAIALACMVLIEGWAVGSPQIASVLASATVSFAAVLYRMPALRQRFLKHGQFAGKVFWSCEPLFYFVSMWVIYGSLLMWKRDWITQYYDLTAKFGFVAVITHVPAGLRYTILFYSLLLVGIGALLVSKIPERRFLAIWSKHPKKVRMPLNKKTISLRHSVHRPRQQGEQSHTKRKPQNRSS